MWLVESYFFLNGSGLSDIFLLKVKKYAFLVPVFV